MGSSARSSQASIRPHVSNVLRVVSSRSASSYRLDPRENTPGAVSRDRGDPVLRRRLPGRRCRSRPVGCSRLNGVVIPLTGELPPSRAGLRCFYARYGRCTAGLVPDLRCQRGHHPMLVRKRVRARADGRRCNPLFWGCPGARGEPGRAQPPEGLGQSGLNECVLDVDGFRTADAPEHLVSQIRRCRRRHEHEQ